MYEREHGTAERENTAAGNIKEEAYMRKPRIGLLGMMLDGYEPIFPGIIQDRNNYAQELVKDLSAYAEISFEALATNRAEIEETVKRYNCQELDGIVMVLFTYSHSGWIMNAMKKNHLPLAVAILQPDEVMKPEFTEYDFTINQGIHGAQDNANMLRRLGIPFQVFAGSRKGQRFATFFGTFAKAAAAYHALQGMRIAVIGKMNNMCDVFADDIGLQQKLGCEYSYEEIGSVRRLMDEVTEEAAQERMAYEREVFAIDASMTEAVHKDAVTQYLALKQFMEQGNFDAITIHFETLGTDGRFERLPFLAASNLMADGYGYAAEGDAMCATLMKLAMLACDGQATFSEMYAMDFASGSVLMCHAGEGNWQIARKDRKPRLIDKVFNEGGLANPPTPLFTPEPGEATVVSLAYLGHDQYKFVVSHGELLDKCDMRGCEMPYLFFKPDTGLDSCVEGWLAEGGTHHEAVMLGDTREYFKMLSKMIGVEYVEV